MQSVAAIYERAHALLQRATRGFGAVASASQSPTFVSIASDGVSNPLPAIAGESPLTQSQIPRPVRSIPATASDVHGAVSALPGAPGESPGPSPATPLPLNGRATARRFVHEYPSRVLRSARAPHGPSIERAGAPMFSPAASTADQHRAFCSRVAARSPPGRHGQGDPRAHGSRVRAPGRDPHRQRRALRNASDSRVSCLNVWWVRLGIVHQRSRPGCPQGNGAHERAHRTLERPAVRPVRGSYTAGSGTSTRFVGSTTASGPHERLQQQTPRLQYVSSPRPYPARLPPLEYPRRFVMKKITTGGAFRSQHKLLYLAKRWSINTSDRKKPTMGSGRSTSIRCCWRPLTSGIASSPAARVLPMLPDHPVTYLRDCSAVGTGTAGRDAWR